MILDEFSNIKVEINQTFFEIHYLCHLMRFVFACFLMIYSSAYVTAQVHTRADSSKNQNDTLRVNENHFSDPNKEDKADLVIDFAKKFLGVPYRYAGSSPAGFDCSGFVQYVLKKYGIDITRTSASMATYGVRVKLEDVRKGDLLLFNGSRISKTTIGHVGIVIENNDGIIKFIHSANGGVQITTFNNSRYYVPRFVMARRIEF